MMIHPYEEQPKGYTESGLREVHADRAAAAMFNEYVRARRIYKTFNSAHEALAVIWEEFEELKAAIFALHPGDSLESVKKEAIQVGAMAVALLSEVSPYMASVVDKTEQLNN